MCSWSEVVSTLTNAVMAISAISAATAAFMGLKTWKEQSEWQADNELAKRSLMTVYKYRDSLYSVRHPAMWDAEMEVSEEDLERIPAKSERSAGIINAYANRWEKHIPSRNALEAILLEADAVWGDQLRNLVAELKALEHELYHFIELYFAAYHRRGDSLESDDLEQEYREILKSKRDVLYDVMDDDRDEFRSDFIAKLKPIEDYLRGKLGRRK